MFLTSNKLEQLELILEQKILGFGHMQEKLENTCFLMSTSKICRYLEWQEMSDVRLWPSKFASNAFLQKIAKLQLFQHNFATQVYTAC